MLTLTRPCLEYAVTLLTFFFAAVALTAGHVVHTPSPRIFKSRSKGQVVCYACISYAQDSDSQQFYSRLRNFTFNTTDLYQELAKGGLRIPKYAVNCGETHPANIPNYYGIDLAFCPNSDADPGACVKLKGRYKGGQYIYRNCWSKMWIDVRPYVRQMSERCYIDELVQNFVATTDNKICFCEDDLCNGSYHGVQLFNALYFVALYIVFFVFMVM